MPKKNNNNLFILLLLANIFIPALSFADSNIIKVYCNKEIGTVNRKVFGNNFLGYDPTTYETWTQEYYGYSDYGAGIWDPRLKEPVKEVIALAKASGITVARFPGGCGTHHYNWKNSIGSNRKHFLYGMDEFLNTCEALNAEPVITMSYFTGSPKDAAELVEYLNLPSNKRNRWAKQREINGRKKPYGVTYFEIGNEVWHGDDRSIKEVSPKDYAKKFLKYYKAIKSVDSSAKVGVVLYTADWNREVMGIVKNKVDFGIIHLYPSSDTDNSPEEIFRVTLALPGLREEEELKDALLILKEKSRRNIPLAITEYNGGFVHDDPLPYRHCLGTALLNAELLRIFMKPECNILLANYWQFCNSHWGMVSNGFDGKEALLHKPYYLRPNYFVFELYHKHFGDILIDTKVECEAYKLSGYSFSKKEGSTVPYLSVNASKSKDGNKLYLMVINKNMKDSIVTVVELNDFKPDKNGEAWVLKGPKIDSTNEKEHNNVKVSSKKLRIKDSSFRFSFEPHSLTAIELVRN